MTIEFHFYSISKSLAGQSTRQIVVPEGATVAQAVDRLVRATPALEAIRHSCLFAIGTDYARADAALAEGDVVSIIPPMQGG